MAEFAVHMGAGTFDVVHVAEFLPLGELATALVEASVGFGAGRDDGLVDALADAVEEHMEWVFEIARYEIFMLAYGFHGEACVWDRLRAYLG